MIAGSSLGCTCACTQNCKVIKLVQVLGENASYDLLFFRVHQAWCPPYVHK